MEKTPSSELPGPCLRGNRWTGSASDSCRRSLIRRKSSASASTMPITPRRVLTSSRNIPRCFVDLIQRSCGHGAPIVRPRVSEQLDYEGELVVIIGKRGRHITADLALEHVAGYSIFNDASVRDYQFKSPQWTAGKNFDATGAFGPGFVTADDLPPGARGLRLQTRLNGQAVQDATTAEMILRRHVARSRSSARQ